MGYNTHAFVSLAMLSRPNRLTKRKDFETLFKRGKVVHGRHAQIRLLRTDATSDTRIAVVISAKTEKSAVRRNRVKRQTREILRLTMSQVKPGFDAAITLRPSFVPLTYGEKRNVLLMGLSKAGLLNI